MRWKHDALERVYPGTEFNVELESGVVRTWDTEQQSWVPFTYDENLVNTAHETIVVEKHWEELRSERNKLLSKTDWMANSDVTMSDEWRTYRQALRDLPDNTANPASPVWPTEPS